LRFWNIESFGPLNHSIFVFELQFDEKLDIHLLFIIYDVPVRN
jgi:hypothetical protein